LQITTRFRRLSALTFVVGAVGLTACGTVSPIVPNPTPNTGPLPTLPSTTAPPSTMGPPPTTVPEQCSSSSAALVCRQVTVGGVTRKVFAHVPTTAAPAAGRPVVLFFHGDGGGGNGALSTLYRETDPEGAIVLQLDGPNNVPSYARGGTAWSFYMDGTGPDDVLFTKVVVDELLGGTLLPGVAADADRVYAVGGSRGGFMVDTLAVDVRTSGYFAGVVNLWGAFYCESGDDVCQARIDNGGMTVSTPVLHIHGDADPVVAPPARVPSPVTKSISWPWPLAQFAYGNGCSGDFGFSATLTSMGGYPTYRYSPVGGCPKDIQLVLVKGGGHGVWGWEAYAWSFLSGKARS